MKKLILAALLATCTAAHADTALTVSAWSYHLNRGAVERLDLNERNVGAGIEHDVSETVAVVAGAYRNSFHRTSVYAGANWLPITLGPVRLGAQGGVITGYANHPVRPYAAALMAVDMGRYGVNVLIVPPAVKVGGVVTAQIKFRF